MPLVSVVIPAYNSGRYLDEAVRSVIAQTFTDWECIVVDDGSTEDLSRIGKMDPRVRLIRQPNSGVAAARNIGVAHSTGEFVAFLDHDDIWLPEKLEAQVTAMKSDGEIGACYVCYDEIDGSGNRKAVPISADSPANYYDFLRSGAPIPSTILVQRLAFFSVGGLDPTLPYADDQDFMLKLACLFNVKYLPTRQVLYRLHGGNASTNYYRVAYHSMMNLAWKHAVRAEQRGDNEALSASRQMRTCWRRFFGIRAYDAARRSVRDRDIGALLRHLRNALTWNPRYAIAALAKFPFQRAGKEKK